MTTTVALVLMLTVRLLFGQEECTSNFIGIAEADFDGDFGVDGYVQIQSNGSIKVDITVETSLDTSICSGDPFPLEYHIHEVWNYPSDDTKDKYGPGCDAEYTAGHFNPYGGPTCDQVAVPTFYNCEIGDLSGRFGEDSLC